MPVVDAGRAQKLLQIWVVPRLQPSQMPCGMVGRLRRLLPDIWCSNVWEWSTKSASMDYGLESRVFQEASQILISPGRGRTNSGGSRCPGIEVWVIGV